MQSKNIQIAKLEPNEGQIKGLPKNPRFIKDERFKSLVKSIEDDPEMLALRECIVYPNGSKFVVIAGNMRYRACLQLGYKDIPCKVLSKETPVEKLRAYTIKDNVSFGSEDWDLLANEWEESELKDFGMESGFNIGEATDEFTLADGEKGEIEQITFKFTSAQAAKIKKAIGMVLSKKKAKDENKNTFAIMVIVKEWITAQ